MRFASAFYYGCFALLLVAASADVVIAQPYYAKGDYYAGQNGIWQFDEGNMLFDDGLHGDGAAGDGVYGAFVQADQGGVFHEWKIADADWTMAWPSNPDFPLSNAVLFLDEPPPGADGDNEVFFRLDTNTVGDGWQPATNAVACDRFSPPGVEFEVIGSPPEIGNWAFGVPATLENGVWWLQTMIADPGMHEFKFRVLGTWDVTNLGIHYNMFQGQNFSFETTRQDAHVRFEFNTMDGRGRAVEQVATPVNESSWGKVKSLWR